MFYHKTIPYVQERFFYPCLPDLKLQSHPPAGNTISQFLDSRVKTPSVFYFHFLCEWYPELYDILLSSGPLPPEDSPTMGESQQGFSLPTPLMGGAAAKQDPLKKATPQHFYQFTLTY